MPALTRGPLPPSVYWRRRLIVLTAVLILLWAVIHLLTGGDSTPKAATAAHLTDATSSASPKPSASSSASKEPSPSPSPTAPAASETPTPSPTVRPTPTGDCPPSDVSVTPTVTGASAGSDVAIVLNLTTFTTPACTWHISPKTMQVKVATAHGTDVWSTIDCPTALPKSDVVVYRDTPTPVTVTWSARRSDSTCSTHTAWAQPGTYAVTGVALGGTPDQASFTLGAPVAPVAPTPASPTASATPSAPTASATAAAPTSSASATATPKKKHHKKKHVVAD